MVALRSLFNRAGPLLPGLAIVTTVSAVATALGQLAPTVGAPVFGIALGMLVQALRPPSQGTRPGIAFSAKYVLQVSVVALGLGLSVSELFATATDTLPVMLGTLGIALVAAAALARLLRIDRELFVLIGAGTAICGGSAIAATSSVIGASRLAVAYAMSTIFLFNATAVVLFPALGHAFDLSQTGFGIWAGTAINDTSSVVAAGYHYGTTAGDTGLVVKLARTTMIIPLTLALAAWQFTRRYRAHREEPSATVPWRRVFPWFIAWFCVATTANTIGLVPEAAQDALGVIAVFLITMALTGVGLSAQFGQMRETGIRPLVFGGLLWMCVALGSLALQSMTGLL